MLVTSAIFSALPETMGGLRATGTCGVPIHSSVATESIVNNQQLITSNKQPGAFSCLLSSIMNPFSWHYYFLRISQLLS